MHKNDFFRRQFKVLGTLKMCYNLRKYEHQRDRRNNRVCFLDKISGKKKIIQSMKNILCHVLSLK